MSFEDFVDAVVSVGDDEADEHIRSQHTFLAGLGPVSTPGDRAG